MTMATTDRVHFASDERARQAPLELPPIAPSYHQFVSSDEGDIYEYDKKCRAECHEGRSVSAKIRSLTESAVAG